MRFTVNYLLLLVCFCSFLACNNSPSSEKKDPSVSDASKAVKTNFYRHFRGTIGTEAITMDLVETKTAHVLNEMPRFNGYYSYDKSQEPMPVSGFLDSTGQINLEVGARHTGDFRGKMNADSTFSGTWFDIGTKSNAPFSLRETLSDGSISMDVFPFEDSLKLFENAPNSPQAIFSVDALLPAKNTEGSFFEYLRQQIFKELKGDSLIGNYDNLQISDIQKTARDSFFSTYKNELKDEKTDIATNEQLNFSSSLAMEVVSNTDGLLTLGFTNYAFSGGAHGNYGTKLLTYSVLDKKRMTLNDIFKPNYKSVLDAALKRKARQFFGIKPNESLKDNGVFNEVEANDNFAITRKGVLFNYTPYEIASYAEGEIQLFIPFDELKSILK
jgi:hypothetical protein